jgi:hypothetical protein
MYHKQGGSWHKAASELGRAQEQTTLLEAEVSPCALTPARIIAIIAMMQRESTFIEPRCNVDID